MSRESHERAMRTWRFLEDADPAVRLDVLADGTNFVHGVPCSAGLSAFVFRRLGLERDYWPEMWEKLYGRPVARVWKMVENAADVKPEALTTYVRAFGSRVEALEADEDEQGEPRWKAKV